ncbi:MAG: hypothetical protein H6710_23040 [Myxococcales bacterium]|nr:hypothetical protein [Myxococcales bacterium]
MDTTSGILSIQEALQHDRGLRLRREPGARTIPIDTLSGPPLAEHPFAAMQAALPDPNAGAPEPLAAAAPAEFWYVRSASLPLLLRLLDEADTWITPAVQLLQQNPEDRRLSERYATSLGVQRGEIARVLGSAAVGHVAIVGSDPYVREGTDVTLIFELREPTLYNAELDRYRLAAQQRAESSGGWLKTSARDYEGVTIESTRDSLHRCRQERAIVGGLGLVSNSPRAIERVIDAIAGRRPRLADAADFRYMRAREGAQAHDVSIFLSDALIAAVVGPVQKIQAARREQALAELLVPGYAALLYGWLEGAAPASREALVKSGLLAADELRHRDGEKIDFEAPRLAPDLAPPTETTRSSWGTPAELTPILDLPPLTRVSAEEESAYRGFAATYQTYWKRFIDPVAVNLDIRAQEDQRELVDVDVRVLPLIDATDYRELTEMVGDARIEVSAQGRGLRVVYGVGAESPLRRDLDGLLRAATGKAEIGVGWVGDWVMLGIEDRAALADLYVWLEDRIQLPDRSRPDDIFGDEHLWHRVGRAPVYAGAAVRSSAALVATLGALRTMINEIVPGTIEWGEHSRHRAIPIVRVGVRRDAPLLTRPELADAIALYYAQTSEAVVLALDPEVLHPVLDRLLDGHAPKPGAADGPQLVFEATSGPGQALWTVGHWLLQAEATSAQTIAERGAEILLLGTQGAHSQALVADLALAYFGAIPLSARGAPPMHLTPTGASDPLFGTAIARAYPPLPIKGAPIERLMERLRGVRLEVSFDREPAAAGADARSLHTHLQLELQR